MEVESATPAAGRSRDLWARTCGIIRGMTRTHAGEGTVALLAAAALVAAWATAAGCDEGSGGGADDDSDSESGSDADGDADSDADVDTDTDTSAVESCYFDYDEQFAAAARATGASWWIGGPSARPSGGAIAHAEPPAPSTFLAAVGKGAKADLVLPGYEDDMPLFERGGEWTEATRCYELPYGARLLTEDQAYDLYRSIAEETTGVVMDTGEDVRAVVGIRGAYPGTFDWHGNEPDRFNDTLVLLWVDGDGGRHVREFAVNTDLGAYYFGFESSSNLRPNRRYRYVNGWHGSTPYNALHIDEDGYRVRNDTNANGHWDDDRNGWLPPAGDDYFRGGGGHNIHMGSVDGPLGSAAVQYWSAGCQVIPGMASWEEFITNAWTELGDSVDYFLVDARDVNPQVWYPCEPDGTHGCPYEIDVPTTVDGDTALEGEQLFDLYNCSAADEAGPEVVYAFTVDQSGALTAAVDCEDPVDVDIHLLEGDDPDACLARDHLSLSYDITPGRYLLVVDSYFDGVEALAGPYTLTVTID